MNAKQIRAAITTKTAEVRSAIDKQDIEAAKKSNEELRALKESLKIAEELEQQEEEELKRQAEEEKEREEREKNNDPEKRDKNFNREDIQYRAIGKYLLRRTDNAPVLTKEERASINIGNSGAILPEGFVNQLIVLTKGFPSLKQYCHVIPVTTNTGKMPISKGSTTRKLAKLATDTEMVKEMITTEPVDYAVEDYGKIYPIENSVLEDSGIDLYNGMLAPDVAECSVNSENAEIIAIVKANAVAGATGSDYKAIQKTLNKMVLPSLKKGTIILTNTSGYSYLDELTDNQGRPLLNESLAVDGGYTFKGRPIVTLDDTDIVPTTAGKIPFYIVNLFALCKFFDRKSYEIATSTEAGFTQNQTFTRVIERFEVTAGDTRCDFYIEL